MIKAILSSFVLMTFFFSSFVFADGGHETGVMIERIEIRATTKQAGATAAYAVIHNHGTDDDRLIGASASFARKTELHEMTLDGDVMKMRALTDGIALPAGGTIILKKRSDHIMLMGLTEQVLEDQRYQITLEFEKAGAITFEAQTIPLSGKTRTHTHEDTHKHTH